MERGRHGLALGLCIGPQERHILGRREHRDQGLGRQIARARSGKAVKHIDEAAAARGQSTAQRCALVRRCDEKAAAARLEQRTGDLQGAQPLAVGLDDAGDLRPRRARSKLGVIGDERAEVDGEAGLSGRGRWDGPGRDFRSA